MEWGLGGGGMRWGWGWRWNEVGGGGGAVSSRCHVYSRFDQQTLGATSEGKRDRVVWLVNNWILMSRQPYGVTSGTIGRLVGMYI